MRKKSQRKRKRRRQFNTRPRRRARSESSEANAAGENEEKFGFKSGSDFTLDEFERYAEEFKESYFRVKERTQESSAEIGQDSKWRPTINDIEGEYWRIIEQPTDEVEVRENEILTIFPSLPFIPSHYAILWSILLCM